MLVFLELFVAVAVLILTGESSPIFIARPLIVVVPVLAVPIDVFCPLVAFMFVGPTIAVVELPFPIDVGCPPDVLIVVLPDIVVVELNAPLVPPIVI
jgi:hypothetical protein